MKSRILARAVLAASLGMMGCGDDNGSGGNGGSAGTGGTGGVGGAGGAEPRECTNLEGSGVYSIVGAPATSTDDCTTTLTPSGGDDSAALNTAIEDASSEDVICLGAGSYDMQGTVSVSAVAQLTLKGIGDVPDDVVLDYANSTDGTGINVATDGFTIENLWIKNTLGNSIEVRAADSVFRKIFATWDAGSVTENGAYAIFPRNCENTLIEYSEVIGASDAGIYVGQCVGGIVRNNKTFANVTGIEIENSEDIEVYENEVFDNTGGLLAFELSGLDREAGNVLLRDNDVYCNNRANFAREGTFVTIVPAGTGALINGGRRFEFRNNVIESNVSTGFLITSNVLVCQLEGEREDCLTGWPEGFDPYPTEMFLNQNTFINNGTDPQETLAQILTVLQLDAFEDVLWDGNIDPMVTDPEICLGDTEVPSFRNLSNNQCGAESGLLPLATCWTQNTTISTEGRLCTPDPVTP